MREAMKNAIMGNKDLMAQKSEVYRLHRDAVDSKWLARLESAVRDLIDDYYDSSTQ